MVAGGISFDLKHWVLKVSRGNGYVRKSGHSFKQCRKEFIHCTNISVGVGRGVLYIKHFVEIYFFLKNHGCSVLHRYVYGYVLLFLMNSFDMVLSVLQFASLVLQLPHDCSGIREVIPKDKIGVKSAQNINLN